MSQFCSLDEAFAAQVPMPGKKKKRTRDLTEGFVPSPLAGTPDPDRPAGPMPPANDVLQAPSGGDAGRLDGGAAALHDLFPLPGETAEPEEWQKAFLLESSQAATIAPPQFRRDGSVSVAGRPTLWRSVPVPQAAPAASELAPVATAGRALAGIPSDIASRLDQLTRQLESLTAPTPLQSTAELFLFVAIGLLMLLAIDTLLRFATTFASGRQTAAVMSGGAWRRGLGRRLR
jgi:hypothetical protein